MPLRLLVLAASALLVACAPVSAGERAESASTGPIVLDDMGSIMFGGQITRHEGGDTFHGDYGYAQYFVPAEARSFPLIMWHGFGQSGKTWETTPDGREGFWQIFTRRGWPVYIVDQPRRGRAARTNASEGSASHRLAGADEVESGRWSNFRMGTWAPPAPPDYFPGLAFPTDPDAIAQFMAQQVPNTGPEPFPDAAHRRFMGEAMADLLRRAGPAILFTHSHSGQYGWEAAIAAPEQVKAIVAFEPGEFAFPEDEPPADIPSPHDQLRGYLAPQFVAPADFAKLTRFPILILFGDNIASEPSTDYGRELWRLARLRAEQFVEAVNRHGGDARILDLPAAGLRGNTHFIMSDTNNVAVADLVSAFLDEKGLDGR